MRSILLPLAPPLEGTLQCWKRESQTQAAVPVLVQWLAWLVVALLFLVVLAVFGVLVPLQVEEVEVEILVVAPLLVIVGVPVCPPPLCSALSWAETE